MKRMVLLLCSLFLTGFIVQAQTKKMPTIQTEIKLIPDSIFIESHDDTSYIIITNGNGFLTKNYSLFRKIVDWMMADKPNDNTDNYVLIEGTSVGSLAKFYRSQFKADDDATDEEKKKWKNVKKRALELNGLLYRLTGHKTDSREKKKTDTPGTQNPWGGLITN